MHWPEIRVTYPNQWLIVEALEAHTTPDSRRHLDRLAVVEQCRDGSDAMKSYRSLHGRYPQRELYFVHTSREELEIEERQWLGIRGLHATGAPA
jgi:hypothetical protein